MEERGCARVAVLWESRVSVKKQNPNGSGVRCPDCQNVVAEGRVGVSGTCVMGGGLASSGQQRDSRGSISVDFDVMSSRCREERICMMRTPSA